MALQKLIKITLFALASFGAGVAMDAPSNLIVKASPYGNTLQSSDIGLTHQYAGVSGTPKVPVIHNYTDFIFPHVLIAMNKNRLPQSIIEETLGLPEMMGAVGVAATDPFLIVVQTYSDSRTSIPLLLRPMYFFGQNTAYEIPRAYDEAINLKAGVVGVEPRFAMPAHNYDISIHNGGSSSPILVSSPNNMRLPVQLDQKESSAFFAFYKGKSAQVGGAPQGISVLHVLLNKNEAQEVQSIISDYDPDSEEATFIQISTIQNPSPALRALIMVLNGGYKGGEPVAQPQHPQVIIPPVQPSQNSSPPPQPSTPPVQPSQDSSPPPPQPSTPPVQVQQPVEPQPKVGQVRRNGKFKEKWTGSSWRKF